VIAATTGLPVHGHLREAGLGHLLDVGAGREDLLPAVKHHGTHRGIGVDLRGGGRDLVLDLRVERVHLRPVKTYRRNPALAPHRDELTHARILGHRAGGRPWPHASPARRKWNHGWPGNPGHRGHVVI